MSPMSDTSLLVYTVVSVEGFGFVAAVDRRHVESMTSCEDERVQPVGGHHRNHTHTHGHTYTKLHPLQ